MYARERAIVTVLIWILVAIMFDSAMVHANPGDVIPLTALLGASVAAATYAIWNASLGAPSEKQTQQKQAEKAKRVEHTRVSRLLESLDEAELDELRARLESQGNSMTLEDLLASDDRASYEG